MKNKRWVTVMPVLAAGFAFLFTGCAGTQKNVQNKLAKVKSIDKVALIQICGDPTVRWSDEEEDEIDIKSIEQKILNIAKGVLDGKSIQASLKIGEQSAGYVFDKSVDILFKNISEIDPIPLIPKEKVTENPDYKAEKEVLWRGTLISEEGFRVIDVLNKNTVNKIAESIGVDALLTVYIEFKNDISTGVEQTGIVKAFAEIRTHLIDKSGQDLWIGIGSVHSDEEIDITKEAYDPNRMNMMFIEAFDKASKDVFMNLKWLRETKESPPVLVLMNKGILP